MRSLRRASPQGECKIIIELHHNMESVRDIWRDFQSYAQGGPHDTWEWNEAWARTGGAQLTPQIIIGRNPAGKVILILPLRIRTVSHCAILEWLGAEQANYCSGLFDPKAFEQEQLPSGKALMMQVLTALPPIDAVHLAGQPLALAQTSNPLADLPAAQCASHGHGFPIGENWEDHFNDRFSAHNKRNFRRVERRLSEHGALQFKSADTASDRLSALEQLFIDKRAWFAENGITDFFSCKNMRDFYRSLAEAKPKDNAPRLRIFELTVDGETVASNLGIIHQNRFYGLIASTRNGPMLRHGPGQLLFKRIVEQLANEGINYIDFGAGEDSNKLRWCTEQRTRQHAILPRSVKGHAFAAVLSLALCLKKMIKHSPLMWRIAQRMRRDISRVFSPSSVKKAQLPADGLEA